MMCPNCGKEMGTAHYCLPNIPYTSVSVRDIELIIELLTKILAILKKEK